MFKVMKLIDRIQEQELQLREVRRVSHWQDEKALGSKSRA
jgi:hypothetical protein